MQKIRLTTNAHIDIPQHLSNVDSKYGFSYYSDVFIENKTIENSFTAKLLSKLDKFWSKFKPISIEDKNIVSIVADRANFLSQHVSSELINNLQIQLNIKTDFNSKLNEASNIFATQPEKFLKTKESLNDNTAYIYAKEGGMFLGLEIFKSDTPLMKTVREELSQEDLVSFVFFHEYSHSLDIFNQKKFQNEHSILTSHLQKINLLNSEHITSLNKAIKTSFPNGDYELIDEDFVENILSQPKEIYADVASILIQRNYDIINNQYSLDKIKKLTSTIDQGRKNEMLDLQKNCGSEYYIQQVNHFTSPGLETLKEELNNIPDKILTQEEIHHISQECVKIGMAKTIYTLVNSNNNLVPQLKTLFSLSPNPDFTGSFNDRLYGIPPFNIDNSINYYKETIDSIKDIIGQSWINEFEQKNNFINNAVLIQDKIKTTFHSAFITSEYKKEFDRVKKLEDQLEELFEPSTPIIDVDKTLPNTKDVQSSIAKIREKILQEEVFARIDPEKRLGNTKNIQEVLTKMRESNTNTNNKLKI